MANSYKLFLRHKIVNDIKFRTVRFNPTQLLMQAKDITVNHKPHKELRFENSYKYYDLTHSKDVEGSLITEPQNVFNYDGNVRTLLYSDEYDEIVTNLQSCLSVESVFKTMFQQQLDLKHFHICQAILVLWDLQNVYSSSYLHNLSKDDIINSPEHMLNSYICNLKSHPDFQKLLYITESHIDNFNFNEATFCMHFLKKMGLGLDEPIQKLLINICNHALDNDEHVSLQAILHLSHVIRPLNYTGYTATAKAMLSYIYKSLAHCNSLDVLECITLTLENIHLFVSKSGLALYKAKVDELTDTGLIGEAHRTLTKIIHFLNMPHWSNTNFTHIKFLCYILKDWIKEMDVPEIVELNKAINHHFEPCCIIDEVNKRSQQLLEELQNDDRVKAIINIPHLLFCQILTLKQSHRKDIESLTNSLLKDCYPSSFVALYKILRYLKPTHKILKDNFWQKVVDESVSLQTAEPDFILRLCHKYMYFDNSPGNKYRHYNFENYCITFLIDYMKNTAETAIPKKLARITSFIIAYCDLSSMNHNDLYFIHTLIERVESASSQFDEHDCVILSKALLISSQMNENKFISQSIRYFYHRIDVVLSKCTQRLCLLNRFKSLDNSNLLMKSYINRQASYKSDIFHDIIALYANVEENISSRSLKDAAMNMLSSGTVVPQLIETMLSYGVSFKDDILGDTAQKFLFLCYRTGYIPTRQDFWKISCNLINRDRDSSNGLSLLTSCMALTYFDSISEDLLKYVFSLKFMEVLEDEISTCYSKPSYPIRVRKVLMNLNRAVCLEYPEYEIPWFHNKYLQELISLTSRPRSLLHNNIMETLVSIVKKKEAVQASHFTPYGLHVDFLLHLDKGGNPVPIRKLSPTSNITKVAVLILESSMYSRVLTCKDTKSFQHILIGPYLMNRKHLEIMGYKVVEVPRGLWNAMHMAEPGAKISYLESKIWPKD